MGDNASYEFVSEKDGIYTYNVRLLTPLNYVKIHLGTLMAAAQPQPAPVSWVPHPQLYRDWWCPTCAKSMASSYPSTNHYCPTCRTSCAPYNGQNIYPHAQNTYTRSCSDPACGATWSGTGYVPVTCPMCHQMANKLQFECKPCGIRYLEGASTANARHLASGVAVHDWECPQCSKMGTLAQVAVTAAVTAAPAPSALLPSGPVPLHDWGLIDQGERTCKRCGVVENMWLGKPVANCRFPQGFKFTPKTKCECDIRDLMTYGHKAGCPEKKR